MRTTSVFRLAGLALAILIAGSGSAAAVDGDWNDLLPSIPTPLEIPTLLPESPGTASPSPDPSPTTTTTTTTDRPMAWARPASDAAGAAVVVEGANWKPSTPVLFYFDPNDTRSFVQGHPGLNGRFAECFTLPQRSIGSHTWRVCQDCGLPTEKRVFIQFTVTSTYSRQPRDPRCPSPPPQSFSLNAMSGSETPRPTASPTKPSTSTPTPSLPPALDVGSSAEIALKNQTESGFIAFNPVRQMRVDETERVEVNIRRALSEDLTDTVKKQLSEGLSKEGKVEFDTLTVGNVMVVRLDENDDFTINPLTSDRQVLGDDVTTWEWDVTPRKAGRRSLVLCVAVEIELEGRHLPAESTCEFERQIDVKVNPLASTSSFMSDNWQWLIGGPIGTAAFAWLAREGWLKRKKDPTGGESPPQPSGS